MFRRVKRVTLNARLLIYTFLLLTMTTMVIGYSSFQLSKNALDERGQDILENGVHTAMMLIEEKRTDAEEGFITQEEAQEDVKEILLGPLAEDGTRPIEGPVDLGENGYFIVYSPEGIEVLHPTLEGEDVWDVTDVGNDSEDGYLFVQDKINQAMDGGGFVHYTWNLPFEEETGEKVVYADYDEDWEWVVTAGTYMTDFNEDANAIMWVTFAVVFLLVIGGVLLSVYFFSGFTKPLMSLEQAMVKMKRGSYERVPEVSRQDEVGQLVSSYNKMVNAMQDKDDRIYRYAYYDDLTGLPNRNWLNDYAGNRLEEAGIGRHLVLLDARNFKVINSLYGHAYGDEMIRILGGLLSQMETGDDVKPVRIGGNEFAIWVERFERNELLAHIREKKRELNRNYQSVGFSQALEFHIGVCSVTKDIVSFEELYQRASVAMQIAKEHQEDQAVFFEQEMYDAIEKRTQYKHHLETALNRNEFTLFYQEKHAATDRRVIGVEALCRWESSEFGFVNPGDFIPAIDRAGLMMDFTEHVTKLALKDYPELVARYGAGVEVSINIPPVVFLTEEYRRFLNQQVQKRGISPEHIVLEITEDVFIAETALVNQTIKRLREDGFKISLDDFGSGYSSLSYISQFQTDEVKVDKSFIDRVETDDRARILLVAIINIAHSMGYRVVVEGVETEGQVRILRQTHCDVIQGFVYARPEPLKRIS
ncbi:EAL domain-containing protein [Salisediminibacterium beveridgei]|uniref:Putative signaling protein n=1 Tax=Salisediminibacterium beveridgei TaxID=632773 RepID=A0A1D7QYA0_9BACI|nr:EAL domain-containing protein [Salisediminibacterium beveridgei]AOM83984.1 putative signaling protein [Salisediminibacterium beveridgei]